MFCMFTVGDPKPISSNPLEMFRGMYHIPLGESVEPLFLKVIPKVDSTSDLFGAIDAQPIICCQRVKVLTPSYTYTSQEPLVTFVGHGGPGVFASKLSHAVTDVYAEGAVVESKSLVEYVNKWLRSNRLPEVQIFISCDMPGHLGIKYRWDQSDNNQVLGMAGVPNEITVDEKDGTLVWDMKKEVGVNPFTNDKHVKHELVEQLFTQKPIVRVISRQNL
jgi:hypothetical protein